MNDVVREQLRAIVVHYGHSLCDEPARCEALLRDYCRGEHRAEAHVLGTLLRAQIPQELLRVSGSVPEGVVVARLVERARQDLMLTEQAAQWGVESWALALGVDDGRAVAPRQPTAASAQAGSSMSRPARGALTAGELNSRTDSLDPTTQRTFGTGLGDTIRATDTRHLGQHAAGLGQQANRRRTRMTWTAEAFAAAALTFAAGGLIALAVIAVIVVRNGSGSSGSADPTPPAQPSTTVGSVAGISSPQPTAVSPSMAKTTPSTPAPPSEPPPQQSAKPDLLLAPFDADAARAAQEAAKWSRPTRSA
jgi:hypothetical protein